MQTRITLISSLKRIPPRKMREMKPLRMLRPIVRQPNKKSVFKKDIVLNSVYRMK